MRRALAILGVIGLLGAAVLAIGAGDTSTKGARYDVVLDNAFGLIEGADVKIAGVRAGQIKTMELDRDTMRARIGIEIKRDGFGDLRADTFCETRPQSLIGEYFIDCQPGVSREHLPHGATIPVKQTASTVPVDLVNDIMRRPYRERFSILLSELGAGLAARGEDLNATIRRAVPALRETDKVLALLAEQRRTIRDLYTNADKVITKLANAKKDVGRFVVEAGDTASVSAKERVALRAQFQRLPTFLNDLGPTMHELGRAADAQAPALRALKVSAPQLKTLLDDIAPFSTASRPAIRSLSEAAKIGKPAADKMRPNARRLARAGLPLPELANNLAMVLEHLDDPKFAVEKDPRSPRGGSGYTGLEALLRYVFFQGQATNIFDSDGHILKVSAFIDQPCATYFDAAKAKDPALKRCRANLGPTQPGINTPDPTKTAAPAARKDKDDKKTIKLPLITTPAPAPETTAPAPKPAKPSVTQELGDILNGLLPELKLPGIGALLNGGKTSPQKSAATRHLLDYLLGG